LYRKLRVVVLGPPLNNSGGVGTLFTYFNDVAKDEVDLTFIDTRGPYKRAVFSLFNLLSALVKVTYLRLTRQIDLAHLNMGSKGSTFRKLILVWWAKKILNLPVVLHLHASSFDTWFTGLGARERSIIIRGINRADKILVLGEIWRSKLMGFGVSEKIIQKVVMGVPEITEECPDLENRPGKIKILFAGEMSIRKGFPELLDAMAEESLANFELTCVGSGSVDSWLEYLKQRDNKADVIFLGLVPLTKVHELLLESDILVLPSRAEGLPVSVMEALSAKTAVVCTTAGALVEYLQDQVNAVVINQVSKIDIAAALEKLENIETRKLVAENGYKVWKANFDVNMTKDTILREWETVYSSKIENT
jgi:glycosyltransferase involved in cell wall biosynthesis